MYFLDIPVPNVAYRKQHVHNEDQDQVFHLIGNLPF